MKCQIDDIFIPHLREFSLGPLGNFQMNIAEIQFHAVAISLFCSIIAPFGGFLASGFKRAFKVKDFADTIPGHGGFTDRFDCKIITMIFLYFYLTQVIFKEQTTLENAYSTYNMMEVQDREKVLQVLLGGLSNSTVQA